MSTTNTGRSYIMEFEKDKRKNGKKNNLSPPPSTHIKSTSK